MYFTRFILFFKPCDSSLGTNNLRPSLGTIPMSLKMNDIFFKKIDHLPAKFLAPEI